MDEIARRYIDFERKNSERSHPQPPKASVFYDKNQKIVESPGKDIKYPKFNPDL